MKRLTQTTFGGSDAPTAEKGNCWSTCIAMILDLEVDQVPNFAQAEIDWWTDTLEWLNGRGVSLHLFDYSIVGNHIKFRDWVPYIVTGKSPRGNWNHSVVYMNGRLWHDPHPSQRGIETQLEAALLVRQ